MSHSQVPASVAKARIWALGMVAVLVALHCAAHGHQAVVVAVTRGVLGLLGNLLPDSHRAMALVTRLAESLAGQLSATAGAGVRIGVGEVAGDLHRADECRRTADLALRALLSGNTSRAVARLGEVAETATMLQILDTLKEVPLPPELPVTRLAAYDAQHDSGLVDTLRAYLDHFSDLPAAARALGVHPNTLRYRIRRLREVCGIRLDDPEARLLAQLQLRLMSRGSSGDR